MSVVSNLCISSTIYGQYFSSTSLNNPIMGSSPQPCLLTYNIKYYY